MLFSMNFLFEKNNLLIYKQKIKQISQIYNYENK